MCHESEALCVLIYIPSGRQHTVYNTQSTLVHLIGVHVLRSILEEGHTVFRDMVYFMIVYGMF